MIYDSTLSQTEKQQIKIDLSSQLKLTDARSRTLQIPAGLLKAPYTYKFRVTALNAQGQAKISQSFYVRAVTYSPRSLMNVKFRWDDNGTPHNNFNFTSGQIMNITDGSS